MPMVVITEFSKSVPELEIRKENGYPRMDIICIRQLFQTVFLYKTMHSSNSVRVNHNNRTIG